MGEYRLYCLDGGGRITRVEEIEATGDEEAIMIARAFKKRVGCELWQRDRRVAEIAPHIAKSG